MDRTRQKWLQYPHVNVWRKEGPRPLAGPTHKELKGLGRGVTRVSPVYTGWWQSKAVGMLHNARPGSLAKKLAASAAPTSRGQGDGPHLATALAQGLWRKQAER